MRMSLSDVIRPHMKNSEVRTMSGAVYEGEPDSDAVVRAGEGDEMDAIEPRLDAHDMMARQTDQRGRRVDAAKGRCAEPRRRANGKARQTTAKHGSRPEIQRTGRVAVMRRVGG